MRARKSTRARANKAARLMLARGFEIYQRTLVDAAIVAGLPAARPRSAPARIDREARQFALLLRAVLEGGSGPKLRTLVADEVRMGSLAGAGPDQVPAVFDVWRRCLGTFHTGSELRRTIAKALDLLESLCVDRARAWERQRIDVIAVGASAGGIEALVPFIKTMTADVPATVLVVQHIGESGPSFIAPILARGARIPLAPALDGSPLFLGQAYVAPPGHHLIVEPGVVRLVDWPPVHYSRPALDVLFSSAAQSYGRQACSVVLSGTGVDGAKGTRLIHEQGGLTFAQDPGSAQFGAMPESAINTGEVDYTAPIERLAHAVLQAVLQGRRSLRERRVDS